MAFGLWWKNSAFCEMLVKITARTQFTVHPFLIGKFFLQEFKLVAHKNGVFSLVPELLERYLAEIFPRH